MKMQNKLVSGKVGKVFNFSSLVEIKSESFSYFKSRFQVKKINVKAGETVEEGRVLVELE
jgi:hypothetical protein